MIKADLITGFLGSGKTTFLKNYVSYLLMQGQKVGIIVNDHGAINVDMLLVDELSSDRCETEMVIASDRECHMRRFRTKLIAMCMQGFDRVIVEPSGIYDVDVFFDVMHDEKIEMRYEIGNVIAVVDAGLPKNLSPESEYMLATQIASAGRVFISHMDESSDSLGDTLSHIERALSSIGVKRELDDIVMAKSYARCTQADFDLLLEAGYESASYEKKLFEGDGDFDTMFFMNLSYRPQHIYDICHEILTNSGCGNVIRVKGFIPRPDGTYLQLNATRKKIRMTESDIGQDVIIVIGEKLNHPKIERIFKS